MGATWCLRCGSTLVLLRRYRLAGLVVHDQRGQLLQPCAGRCALPAWWRTSEQATVIGGVGNIWMGASGGIMVPAFFMPPAMRALSKFPPWRGGLEGFHTVLLRSGGLSDILAQVAGLLVLPPSACWQPLPSI